MKKEQGVGYRFLIALILFLLAGSLVTSSFRAYNEAHPEPADQVSDLGSAAR